MKGKGRRGDIKTAWDTSVFYRSKRDPRIRRDLEKIKRAYLAFERKYRTRDNYLKNDRGLLAALRDYEKLVEAVAPCRPVLYPNLLKELDSGDQEAQAMVTKFSNELTDYENKILFFDLRLGRVSKKQQQRFLRSSLLAPYRYYLRRLFETSRYNLSEPEEKILNLKSLPSHSLWVDGVEKALAKQTVSFKGERLPLAEAQNRVASLPLDDRRRLQDTVMECLRSVGDFAESELNAVVLNKKINDELRGFAQPYSATILSYENDEKSVLSLVDTVTAHFRVSHRFYRLKARLLGLRKLTYADRSASIGRVQKKFSFTESSTLLQDSLRTIDKDYVAILERLLKDGQVDVYPRVGKSGGAYCLGTPHNPTFVFLNHTDDLNAFTTLAHEMGHAIHTEMAKAQPILYQGFTTSVAETASTLFEQLAFERMFQELFPKEQVIALHDKINGDIATVFRQIAFFNFERDVHRAIRDKGALSKEEMARLLNKHTQAYLGTSVQLKDLDGYFFVHVSHFRRFFYVYSYAYGQLISKVIAARFLADNAYRKEIRDFLSAGCSKSPEHIFKTIGIDTSKPSFFKEGLKSIERDIDRLEKLTVKK